MNQYQPNHHATPDRMAPNITRTALTLTGILILTGCAATTEPTSDPTTPAPAATATPTPEPTPEPAPPTADTLDSVAEAAGIDNFTISTETAPGPTAWGKGTINDTEVRVYQFADETTLNGFASSFESVGVTLDDMIVHGLFLIAPNDPAQLDTIRRNLTP